MSEPSLQRSDRRALAWPIALATVAGVVYAVLTVLVATGVADPLDADARELFRPADVWGPTQLRADLVVEGLRPTRIGLLLPVVAAVVAAVRRSWEPVLVGLQVGLLAVGVVLLSKLAVARPDTHGDVGASGGSYPSGHVVVVLAVLGGCALVLGVRAWWAWVGVALVTLVMGWCLLLQAAHWFTDVLGGALVGICVLAVVASGRGPQGVRAHRRASRSENTS